MFTARITREAGDKIVKDALYSFYLDSLCEKICNNYDDNEVLEIHITGEVK